MVEEEFSLDNIFTEPPRPPTPPATVAVYTREHVPENSSWKEIKIRLVGKHPLWGHFLWNAARAFATYLDEHQEIYKGKNVLELGAGGALPSLVATKNGAKRVVITDYPDKELIDNISYNVQENLSEMDERRVVVTGYIWGRPVAPLLSSLEPNTKFDVIILSDLIFNHSQHDALLNTCMSTLSSRGDLLVFFTHHVPRIAHRDMAFFERAQATGWGATKIVTRKYTPMFLEDSGEEEVRATVHGWRLTLPGTQDDLTIEDETAAAPSENKLFDPSPSYLSATLNVHPSIPPSALPKKTLVLDLNGCLVYRGKGRVKSISEAPPDHSHPMYGSSPRSSTVRTTRLRPYIPSFIQYLNHPRTKEWLDSVVWSSARPESVDEILSKAGFTRKGKGWEELKAVWARDKLGLSVEAYHRKTETIKDLSLIMRSLYEIPPQDIDLYTAHNAILLDDTEPDKKARLQPYNLVQVGTYDKAERKADLEVYARLHPPVKKDKPRHRKRNKETQVVEVGEVEGKDAQVPVPAQEDALPYDLHLLAAIGILERGIKPQLNVAAWIRQGGIGAGVWFEAQSTLDYWVAAGLKTLKELDIPVKSGMTGEVEQ